MPKFSDPTLIFLHQRITTELGDLVDLPIYSPDQYFWNLCQSVMGQQLSEKVAPKIIERVETAVNHDYSPQNILGTPIEKLRAAGLSNAKANYLHNIAEAWQTKKIIPAQLQSMTDEEVIQTLVQIKGVGKWTAEMFLMFTLGRPDIFSLGDYGLRRALSIHYQLPIKASAEEILQITNLWQPHRSFASRILWKSLELKFPTENHSQPK